MNRQIGKRGTLAAGIAAAFTLAGGLGPLPGFGVLVAAEAEAATTTTVGLRVDHDKAAVEDGYRRVVNLGIMGLDAAGNVDTQGASGGSTIVAEVSSVLGTVSPADTTPASATVGGFAAATGYTRLAAGAGAAHVRYADTVSGTDTITVRLLEMRTDAAGSSVTTDVIAGESWEVAVPVVAVAAARRLNIYQYRTAGGLTVEGVTRPASAGADTGLPIGGFAETAGIAGGQIAINTFRIDQGGSYVSDTSLAGTVQVVLAGYPQATAGTARNRASAADAYTLTGSMSQGKAVVTMPSSVTKAGVYTLLASIDGASSRAPYTASAMDGRDYLNIVANPSPAKLHLKFDRSVVSASSSTDHGSYTGALGSYDTRPTMTVEVLDTYGNKTTLPQATDIRVADANNHFGAFQQTLGQSAASLVLTMGNNSFLSPGAISATASLASGSSIAASDPATMTVTAPANGQLCVRDIIGGISSSTATAGAGFTPLALIGVIPDETAADNLGSCPATSAMSRLTTLSTVKVTSLAPAADGSLDSFTLNVEVDGGVSRVGGLFSRSLGNDDANTYGLLFQHPAESYADLLIQPKLLAGFSVKAADPVDARLVDASGIATTSLAAYANSAGTRQVTIDGSYFKLYDSLGNLADTGTATATSALGGTVSGNLTPGTTGSRLTVSYPHGLTGNDTLTFSFTAPTVASVNGQSSKQITVTLPSAEGLAGFGLVADHSEIPVNALVPLTVIPKDANGKALESVDGGWTLSFDSGIELATAGGTAIVSGTNVQSLGGTGPSAFQVRAGGSVGDYNVKVAGVDGAVVGTAHFHVRKYQGGGGSEIYAAPTIETDAAGKPTAASVTGIVGATDADRGKPGAVYVAAVFPPAYGGAIYLLNPATGWMPYDAVNTRFQFYSEENTLGSTAIDLGRHMPMDILDTLAGTQIWMGYGRGSIQFGDPWTDMLANFTYTVACAIEAGKACQPLP